MLRRVAGRDRGIDVYHAAIRENAGPDIAICVGLEQDEFHLSLRAGLNVCFALILKCDPGLEPGEPRRMTGTVLANADHTFPARAAPAPAMRPKTAPEVRP